jgi:aminopeptidase N
MLLIACPTVLFAQQFHEESFYKSELLRYSRLHEAAFSPSTGENIDVTYYKLNLTITSSPNLVSGVVTIKAKSTADSLGSIDLDLRNTLTVSSVTVEGVSVPFVQHPTTVSITLNRSYGNGEMVVLDIVYSGTPQSTGFGSFNFSSHGGGIPWIWSLSQPYGARDWWPCKDHPLDKADSVDAWITVDSTLKVGSNGTLGGILDNGNGTKTWKWAERYPIATYLVSVAISNYTEFTNWFRYSPTDSMPVLNYVLPGNLPEGLANLPRAVPMLEIFSEKFGLYPFINEKYGHAQFGWGGAMEHQTMTSATASAFAEYVVAHELAHQWFGNLITCATWPNLWLNEGFATYSEALYFEAMYGNARYWQDITPKMASAKTAVGSVHVQDTTSLGILFDGALVYNKGASVLHMLRHVMGDSLFFAALRSYVGDPRYRFKTATTEDFRAVCENIAGTQLGYFFNQWIYGEKYPQYSYSWSSRPAATGYDVSIRVLQTTQTANPSFFTMPIDVKLSTAGWDTTIVLFHTYSGQLFTVNVSHQPTSVELDPMNWILRDITTTTAPVPASYVLQQNYPNPFNPDTRISYEIPNAGVVTLKVYDLLGREVAALVREELPPGRYSTQWNATGFSSGVYFYRLQVKPTYATGGFVQTKRMVLIR